MYIKRFSETIVHNWYSSSKILSRLGSLILLLSHFCCLCFKDQACILIISRRLQMLEASCVLRNSLKNVKKDRIFTVFLFVLFPSNLSKDFFLYLISENLVICPPLIQILSIYLVNIWLRFIFQGLA